MPRFITIHYGDRTGYERTDAAVLKAAHANDAELAARGALIGVAGRPVQVRNTEGRRVQTQDGAYLSAELPIAGFAVVDAATVDEAISMVAKSPCAVAHGVIEVWPLEESD